MAEASYSSAGAAVGSGRKLKFTLNLKGLTVFLTGANSCSRAHGNEAEVDVRENEFYSDSKYDMSPNARVDH